MRWNVVFTTFVAVLVLGCGPGGGSGSESGGGGNRDCSGMHQKIGATAELEAKGSYNVDGTAKIVDTCTVKIRNFTYDGDGITVKIYGTGTLEGGAPDFPAGYAMTGDLKGETFNGETIDATLPKGKTLDDLQAISVWCVDAGVDFGSGTFSK